VAIHSRGYFIYPGRALSNLQSLDASSNFMLPKLGYLLYLQKAMISSENNNS